ncbi:hypothetical protein H9L39_10664 [Fusarium oxysporum f. sp. albedinis]|nr:hypothetical protein H9L39_10664 [Fusarium oxysporum f. sp. albedinis]
MRYHEHAWREVWLVWSSSTTTQYMLWRTRSCHRDDGAALMASILTCCPEVNICRWYWRLMGMCPLRDLISCMMTISRDRILSKYKLHQLKTIDNCRPGC